MSSPESTLLTVDGISYEMASFSDEVRNAMAVFETFAKDLQQEELKALKTRSAMDHIRMQIVTQVKKEVEEKGLVPVNEAAPEVQE